MKAAVVRQFKSPLRIEDVPKPAPGPGEVVVKIEASGLCHTDIHAAHGDWPVKPKLPLIPGHEGVGIVESVGAGVQNVKEGDRVSIPWLGWACGVCEYCASGRETLCEQQQNTGYSVDGSYAEYARGSALYVGKIPAERRSARRCAAHLCWRDHLQGREGRGHALLGPRGRVRHRRPRPPGGAVRQDRRRDRRRGRPGRREARARDDARRRLRREPHPRGSGRGDPQAGRRRPGDLPRRVAEGLRSGLPLVAPGRDARASSRSRRRTSCSFRSSRPS